MQLKQRIKKIEEQLNLNKPDANSCDCFQKHLTSRVDEIYTAREESREADKSKYHPMPDVDKKICDTCKKRISKSEADKIKNLIKDINIIHGGRNQ